MSDGTIVLSISDYQILEVEEKLVKITSKESEEVFYPKYRTNGSKLYIENDKELIDFMESVLDIEFYIVLNNNKNIKSFISNTEVEKMGLELEWENQNLLITDRNKKFEKIIVGTKTASATLIGNELHLDVDKNINDTLYLRKENNYVEIAQPINNVYTLNLSLISKIINYVKSGNFKMYIGETTIYELLFETDIEIEIENSTLKINSELNENVVIIHNEEYYMYYNKITLSDEKIIVEIPNKKITEKIDSIHIQRTDDKTLYFDVDYVCTNNTVQINIGEVIQQINDATENWSVIFQMQNSRSYLLKNVDGRSGENYAAEGYGEDLLIILRELDGALALTKVNRNRLDTLENMKNKVDSIYVDTNKIYLECEELKEEKILFSEIIFIGDKSKEQTRYPIDSTVDGFELTLMESPMWSNIERYGMQMNLVTRNGIMSDVLKLKHQKKKEMLFSVKKDDSNITGLVYCLKNGELRMSVNEINKNMKEQYVKKMKVLNIKNRKSKFIIEFEFTLNDENAKIGAVELKLRSAEQQISKKASKVKIDRDGSKVRVIAEINVKWEQKYSLYWDIFVSIQDKNSKEYTPVMVTGVSPSLKKKLRKHLNHALTNKDEKLMFFPYVTFNNDIAFMLREQKYFETKYYKAKEFLAYLIFRLFKNKYTNKEIWLGFEKFSEQAQDNGYAFFEYVDDHKLKDEFYYVITKDAKEYSELKRKHGEKIIEFMSLKYFIYVFAATLLITSESRRHLYHMHIRTGRFAYYISRKETIFLQHGVTALKQSAVFQKTPGRGNYDLVITTSEAEKKIVFENWKYPTDEIVVTGFARWDKLQDKSSMEESKTIFIMPTWRSWLEGIPKEEFLNTNYYEAYASVLKSEELHRILEETNTIVKFFLHPKFDAYIDLFESTSKNVQLLNYKETKINEEIMSASMLVSDYSSITWDMFYMNKPVIFYQFDCEKYQELEGSYIDLENDLFGERAITASELINLLQEKISTDFVVSDENQEKRKQAYAYLDANNSERIYKEIIEKF